MARASTIKNIKNITWYSYFQHAIFIYAAKCLGIEAKSLHDQIDSKLIGTNIYWKKNMAKNDDW